jgi:DNA-binding transcriptional ArsR family regulator
MAIPTRLRRRPAATLVSAPKLEVDWGLAYEALVGLGMWIGGEPEATYEVGPGFWKNARQKASPELRQLVKAFKGCAHVLSGLAGMVRETDGRSVAKFVARVRADRVAEVQRAMLGHDRSKMDLVDAALRGDQAAKRQFLQHSHNPAVEKRLIESDPRDVAKQVADLIELWNRDVFAELAPSLEPALRDSWRAVTRLKDQLPVERLIIRATRGVEYRIESWIHTVVLVPSQLSRPWVDLAEYRGIKLIFYPAVAAGEGSDSELAEIYKALGDETRLRILRLMASGTTSLTDMAERLGLAKSTVHGHLVVLRGAGITRSVVGAGGKTYVLNDRPDLNALFDSFLKG